MKSNTLTVKTEGALTFITFPKLAASGGVRHVFSTRLGGVSTGRYSTMNLSFLNGDNRENVLKNYDILCSAAGIELSHLVLSRQTHTANVRQVTAADRGVGIFAPPFCDVDGLVTNEPGTALVTQYADCTPLLFFDPVKKVAANSHAGWRGTVQGIGRGTVETMRDKYGCRPENIIVGIGPCIGQCCYEVDGPVYDAFDALRFIDKKSVFTPRGDGKYMLDLVETNRQILLHAGILAENMDVSDICTNCNCDILHSHRATNGERGNLAAIIELI